MRKLFGVLLAILIVVATSVPDMAYAGGNNRGNRSRHLLIATSALGGTLAGAVLGIFADRAFLVNSPTGDQPVQSASYAPTVYQQPVPGGQVYVVPPGYSSEPAAAGYSEGYLEGLRQGRQQRYYEARRQGYDAGYYAGLGR